MTKDDKKAEVLNAFSSTVFSNKTSFLNNKPPELEDRDGQHNEDPKPRESGQQPHTPLRYTHVYWAGWDTPKGTKGEVLTEPASIITNSPVSPGRFQLTGGWQKRHPSTRRAGRRVWRTMDMSA